MTESPSLLSSVHEKLKQHFGEEVFSAEQSYDYPVFTVSKDRIIDILEFLFGDPQLQFRFLTTLCGMHFPHLEKSKQFGVVYMLHNLEKNTRIRLKIFLPAEKPEVYTASKLFACADWMERETFDFYGIRFTGHPNLIRILNMEDMVPHPMRKDFPLEDQRREDKEDAMFGR